MARCILSKFYIKPQQLNWEKEVPVRCILSKFYIKPQPAIANASAAAGCILSKFYIKPQPADSPRARPKVVSYRNSTSNHNLLLPKSSSSWLYLIEILHQTTTIPSEYITGNVLYLIEILHQTTTFIRLSHICPTLYLIEILHQTTTLTPTPEEPKSCILSKFYIKPQLCSW